MSSTMVHLPPDGRSTRQARRFVADALTAAGIDVDTIDSAVLLTSELTTNAVLHADSGLTVAVAVLPDRLRVEVADLSDRRPIPAPLSPVAINGRGLHIVEAVASHWGVDTDHPGGKTVWFELEIATTSA